jgi:uncharacterized protein YegP (UPF0339 family)
MVPVVRPGQPRRWGEHMAVKFEIYQDKRGEYRWRLRSANGQNIASSGKGCTSKSGAQNGIDAVNRDAPAAGVEHA